MMEYKRSDRLAGLFQEEIARLLIKGLKDPRVKPVVITGVRVSDDLRHARVYFTVIGEGESREEAQKGLISAGGFIRRELGRRLDLKYLPELTFSFDDSIEYGRRMEALFKELQEEKEPHSSVALPTDSTDQAEDRRESE